jgi:hypothetical protein
MLLAGLAPLPAIAQAPAHQGLASVLGTLARTAPLGHDSFRRLLDGAHTSEAQTTLDLPGAPPVTLDEDGVRLLRAIAQLPRAIAAIQILPGDFALLVDARNAAFAIDLRIARPGLVPVAEPLTDPEFAKLRERYRNGHWYINRGWDPPRNERQALFMGFVYHAGRFFEPPLPWIASVPADGNSTAGSSCVFYTLRNGGSGTLYSLCRQAAGFTRRELVRKPFGPVRASADSRLVALAANHDIRVVDETGREVARIAGENGFAWLDTHSLILFARGMGNPDSVVEVLSGARQTIDACDGKTLAAITSIERGNGTTPTAFMLADDRIVEWDTARRCAREG